jgi:hypothetical protein
MRHNTTESFGFIFEVDALATYSYEDTWDIQNSFEKEYSMNYFYVLH